MNTFVNLLSLLGALAQNLEGAINNYRKQLKGKNFLDVDAGAYSYQLGVYYMDFISECEKLGDYLMNALSLHRQSKNTNDLQ